MWGELNEELFKGKGKLIFDEYRSTIGKIIDKRVFYIEQDTEGNFILVENCDQYFGIKLTPEICKDLSSFFGDLGEYIKN